MMRKVIVAALALSPMLLHAQANSPAQPKSYNTSLTPSRLIDSNGLPTVEGSNAASAEIPLRVSTGVTAPKLIHTEDIAAETDWLSRATRSDRSVVVDMVVNESGKPTDLKIVRSAGVSTDANVLAAVSHYVFKPGSLDGQPTAVPVKLQIEIRPSAE